MKVKKYIDAFPDVSLVTDSVTWQKMTIAAFKSFAKRPRLYDGSENLKLRTDGLYSDLLVFLPGFFSSHLSWMVSFLVFLQPEKPLTVSHSQ